MTTAPGRERLVLVVACLAQFMVVLDVSIVNVALPAMREALGFSAVGLQWVVSAYTLAFAGFLLLGGRAADLFGRRRMFLVGLALFGAASLVGGLADSPGLVLAARAAQGLGGAVLSPATLTILTTTFAEGAARSRALGAWAAIGGVGGAVGGIAGGVLVHFLSWRWIFLVNVPVVLLTAALAVLAITETRAENRPRLDTGGALLVTGGLVSFVHGVVSSESAGWGSPLTWGSFVLAAVLLAGFGLLETRISSPLVPLGIFRVRTVSVANATMALIASAMFAMWYFVSLHMQNVLGFDALAAGLAFLPQSLSIVIGSQLSSRLLARVGPRPLLVGGAFLTAAGFAWFSLLTPESTWVGGVLGPGVAVGLGMGIALTPLAGAATSGLPRDRAGLASGLLNTSRQVGGAIGLSVLSTLATARAATLTAQGATSAAASTAGTTRAFAVAAVAVVLAGLVASLLPRTPAPAHESAPETVDEPVTGSSAAR